MQWLLPRARRHERLRGGGFLGRVRGAYARSVTYDRINSAQVTLRLH
ncbi:hypothetical protein ACFWJT_29910 [Streptomyces sp. NPDC127069]